MRFCAWLTVLALCECALATETIDIFTEFDKNHDGFLDRVEFGRVGQLFGPPSALIPNKAQIDAFETPAVAEALDFWAAFFNSLAMILVTEIGDKTFFIAAIMVPLLMLD